MNLKSTDSILRSTLRSTLRRPNRLALVAVAASALMLGTVPALAQTTTTTTPSTSTGTGSTSTPGGVGSNPMPNKADASKLARADSSMLTDLVEANRAEVEAGKLALEKSQNADIKKFAQMMIDDHTKALGEIESLAQSKNVKLPDGIGAVHKTKEVALKALSGNTFDNQYAKRAGTGDHESTLKLLKKIQADSKDADLKALATKMVPTVEHHLDMAKALPGAK